MEPSGPLAPPSERTPPTAPPEPPVSGPRQLWRNLRALPGNFWESFWRGGLLGSPRARAQAIFSNLFLHIHPVRVHRWTLKPTFTWGLGVAAAALFVILTVTGIMLMVYFKPSEAEAYNSVKDIHFVVLGGRLLRNVHRWAGHLMVVVVFLHMARVFFTRSYLKPREFNWLVGVCLLVLTLALAFTGYCLPWDQLAYWATVIASNIAASPREITDALGITQWFDPGALQKKLLLGSREIGGETILRLYWLHCIFLPLVMAVMVAVHVWRIRKDGGLSRPHDLRPEELPVTPADPQADASFEEGRKTYTLMALVRGRPLRARTAPHHSVMSLPHLFRAELAVFMTVLAVVLVWALLADAPLRQPADPAVPENPAKAPWYFLGLQELVSYSAFIGGLFMPFLAVLVFALIPFLDREPGPAGRWPDRTGWRWAGRSALLALGTVVALLVFLVNFGWMRNWFPDINQLWILLFNPGTILVAVFFVYSLWVTRRTGSTRLGAIAVFTCILVAFTILTYFGTFHRGPNWNFYWWPSEWQGH